MSHGGIGNSHPKRFNEALLAGAYLVVAGLVLIPLLEPPLSVWPLRPGDPSWRFGAAGMLSRGLITSLLGLVLAVAVSSFAGHRRVLRALSVLCGVESLSLLAVLLLLLLDAIQLRSLVSPDAQAGFDFASVGAVLKISLGWLVTLLLAIGGWKASRLSQADRVMRPQTPSLAFSAKGAREGPPGPLPLDVDPPPVASLETSPTKSL